VAAGYALYGPTTMLVLTVGNGVAGLHAEPEPGRVRADPPEHPGARDTQEFAINSVEQPLLGAAGQALRRRMPGRQDRPARQGLQHALDRQHGRRGAPHPDARRRVHVPARHQGPGKPGRLRLLYEANPIGFIMEQAGGRASTGRQPMLACKPRIRCTSASAWCSARATRSSASSATTTNPPRRDPAPAVRRAQPVSRLKEIRPSHHVRTPPHHRHHRLFRRRHHLGDPHLREHLPPRERHAAVIEGDSFHRYDRKEMRARQAEARSGGNKHFSHFGPENNLLPNWSSCSAATASTAPANAPQVPARPDEAAPYKQEPGTFTPWEDLPAGHRPAVLRRPARRRGHPEVDIARHPDLLIGVVPVINLEWIQKLYRDKNVRGYSAEAVTDTILRRMPDYVHYICPQFAPHACQLPARAGGRHLQPLHRARHPSGRRKHGGDPLCQPQGHRLPVPAQHDQRLFHVRANTIVVPGGKMELAMQLIFTPFIWRMMERRKRALGVL
jgi:phosphoribulokinase